MVQITGYVTFYTKYNTLTYSFENGIINTIENNSHLHTHNDDTHT